MATVNNPTPEQRESRTLMLALALLTIGVIVLAIIGFLCLNKPADTIEGQAEVTSVKISGKLPGRVIKLYVKEGDYVKAGDTLVHIHSGLADAKLLQAEAMKEAASAQNKKIDAGTRIQIVQTAEELVAQAAAARGIAQKTYERMENLYKENVISARNATRPRLHTKLLLPASVPPKVS